MNAKLPNEIRQALTEHPDEPLRVDDDTSHTPYVIVRLDVFERMQELIGNGSRSCGRVPIDEVKLTAAILARRDESRELNQDWEHADREVWEAEST